MQEDFESVRNELWRDRTPVMSALDALDRIEVEHLRLQSELESWRKVPDLYEHPFVVLSMNLDFPPGHPEHHFDYVFGRFDAAMARRFLSWAVEAGIPRDGDRPVL